MSRPTTSSPSGRVTRQPLATRNRISIRNVEPGYAYRVVTDIDNRIEELQERGYEIVPQDKVVRGGDKRVDDASALGSVSSLSVGRGMRGVVMRIKEEWNKEDQAVKNLRNDQLEQTMKGDAAKAADYGGITQSFTIK